MVDLINAIKLKQQAWAVELGIETDKDGYCRNLEDNLFQPPSEASRRDFNEGDGSELGKEGKRGKMQALHSSSALACNFFDYWRNNDLKPLAKALGISGELRGLSFEKKFPTGLRGTSPNLDVVLYEVDGTVFAVESKFTEWMGKSGEKASFSSSYFPNGRSLWGDRGLNGCQELAEDLRHKRVQFELLDAAQLLKHMLGLSRCKRPWKLLCLWYGPPGPMTDQHMRELNLFSERIGSNSSRFEAVTYQKLFKGLCGELSDDHMEWQSYMRDRYFE
ncbi:MAG: hypothetical protein JW902_19810 [Syntrophaceae bacterium]|nr:hypothetical protein [Syntrophaceae bacterium]